MRISEFVDEHLFPSQQKGAASLDPPAYLAQHAVRKHACSASHRAAFTASGQSNQLYGPSSGLRLEAI
jgi:hypothetical protein